MPANLVFLCLTGSRPRKARQVDAVPAAIENVPVIASALPFMKSPFFTFLLMQCEISINKKIKDHESPQNHWSPRGISIYPWVKGGWNRNLILDRGVRLGVKFWRIPWIWVSQAWITGIADSETDPCYLYSLRVSWKDFWSRKSIKDYSVSIVQTPLSLGDSYHGQGH